MEEIELSAEQRDFAAASEKLAAKIRAESSRLGYDLDSALSLVEGGNLTIHVMDERGGMTGLVGLPAAVGLYLTASACGGLFPQPPSPRRT